MQALLSFEKAPPFAAPLRFFITAPLFGMAAGGLLLIEGEAILASRWMPATLALTHLLVIGFMLQIMVGALIQILPVVAGANLQRPLSVARIVHPGISLGALLLAVGFWLTQPRLLSIAALLLVVTLGVFLFFVGKSLLGVPSTSPTIRGIKLALVSLAVVVLLGACLAVGLAHGWSLPYPALTDLHAAWGLGAWAGILLAAMAYVVVPMFQLTPGYPARPSWWFPCALLALLLLWSAGVALELSWLVQVLRLLLAICCAAFALLTLRLQSLRRRARADATYRYWQAGLLGVILALAMLSTAAVNPDIAEAASWTPAFGILLVGAFMAFIIGMLYKIVPFLSWLHLQNAASGKLVAPPMNKLLGEADCLRQFHLQMLAWAALLLACLGFGLLVRVAGGLLLLSQAWLLHNLWGTHRRYRGHLQEINEKLASRR